MASITFRSVSVRFGSGSSAVDALDRVHLAVDDGELVTVVGASGSGKTTLLRALAGLDRVSSGSVLMDGADVTCLDPGRRDLAMVFQVPHLLPNRSVGRNVAFPLELRHVAIEEIRARVSAEARALHIETLLERSPDQLSAGEAQLVQIARAMVRVPSALLLDEPLARLDPQVRERMRRELRLLQQGYGVTVLLTTNDPVEALAMGDRLVVLDAGRVAQVGVPIEVYRDPRSLIAAQLTGPLEVAPVEVIPDHQGVWIEGPDGRERAWRPGLSAHAGRRLLRGIRPDDERLYFDPDTGARVA